VLSESAWRRHFAADPALIGRTVTSLAGSDRKPIRIIGVLPDRDTLPYAAGTEIFTPIPWQRPEIRNDIANAGFSTVFRLEAGVTMEQASRAVGAAMVAANAGRPSNWPSSSCC
jgi:hypothetical protein